MLEKMKIKAFTLIEIIIAMLVSSIVISIMISLYINFSQTSAETSRDQDLSSEICLLYSALSSDIYKSESTIINDVGLLEINKEAGTVLYEFRNNIVVRSFANNRDTLGVRTGEISITNMDKDFHVLNIDIKEKKGYKLKFRSRKNHGRY